MFTFPENYSPAPAARILNNGGRFSRGESSEHRRESRRAAPAVHKYFGQIGFMRVKDIPNFEQLTDLERLGIAEELAASVRNPEALPAPVAHRLEL